MLSRPAFASFPALMLAASLALASPLSAQEADPPMTVQRLGEIITAIDPDARNLQGRMFELTLNDVPVLVVTDAQADRMRAMVPIRSAEGLEPADLERMMQANFDTALDARYAVAQGRLWGVFIHPLSPLEKDQFLSGIAQTVSLAQTYGSLYTGGASVYGGGDSNGIYQDLVEELRKKGEEI